MATRALVSIEEYLRTSYPEMDCEYVDGEVFEKPMPPLSHAKVQKRLLLLFDRWESNHRLFALPELRNRTGETRCRIPDVAVYAGSEPREEVPTTPPLVAIEILSPDDRMQYLMEKLREYRAWGVAHIWVIDPAAKTLCEYGSDGLREVAALRLPEYGLAVGLGDLFPES